MGADPSKLAMREVTALYLFANTPVYLYRKLRANESVKALSDSARPVELAALAATIDRKRKRSPQDIAVAYSAIVAATFHDSRDVHAAFDSLVLRHIDWASTILQYWYNTLVVTDTRTVRLSPREMEQTPSDTPTTSSLIVLPEGRK